MQFIGAPSFDGGAYFFLPRPRPRLLATVVSFPLDLATTAFACWIAEASEAPPESALLATCAH
jgi:hypothetical protein